MEDGSRRGSHGLWDEECVGDGSRRGSHGLRDKGNLALKRARRKVVDPTLIVVLTVISLRK